MKSLYNKPYKSFTDIVTHLESKGLIIGDRATAETTLKNINYYRFKIYLRPLLDMSTRQFNTGASFNEAYQLYRFDDELRDILFSIIGRIEVKIRTRLDQTIAEHTNNPFWYLDSHNFASNSDDIRPSFNSKFTSSKDDFVKHYKDKYQAPSSVSVFHQNMPPFWVMAELTTFGNIVSLFKTLNKEKFPKDKFKNKLDILSQEFGAPSLDIFNSWLESLRETRNRCAHHSRVWNRNCFDAKGIQSNKSKFNLNLPSDSTVTPTSGRRNRFYTAMFVIFQVSKNLNIDRNIKEEFVELLEKYPKVKIHLHSAGFPSDWDSLKAWNR